MTQLREPWSLGDIKDVEKLVRSVLDKKLRSLNAYINNHDDYEDVVAELFVHVQQMWLRFDPNRIMVGNDGKPRRATFIGFVSAHLPLRVTDAAYRATYGRSGLHRPPDGSCSLDELDPHDADLALNAGDDEDRHQAAGLLDALSPENQRMADGLAAGYTRAEVQRRLGITAKAAAAQHERLREEVAWHLKGAA